MLHNERNNSEHKHFGKNASYQLNMDLNLCAQTQTRYLRHTEFLRQCNQRTANQPSPKHEGFHLEVIAHYRKITLKYRSSTALMHCGLQNPTSIEMRRSTHIGSSISALRVLSCALAGAWVEAYSKPRWRMKPCGHFMGSHKKHLCPSNPN